MRTTQQLRVAWAPACQIQRATLRFWNGITVTIDARTVEAFRALDSCLQQFGYGPKSGQTWGYNCRKITGGSGYSLHAYGIAVDINSLANPYGRTLITDMPPKMVYAVKTIRTKNGDLVFRWGGDYSGNKDAMHFEIVASPAELRSGIDWSTVTQSQSPPSTPASLTEEEEMRYVYICDQAYWVTDLVSTRWITGQIDFNYLINPGGDPRAHNLGEVHPDFHHSLNIVRNKP